MSGNQQKAGRKIIIGELGIDHTRLRELYGEWSAEPEGTEKDFEIRHRILSLLEIHGRLELEIFYPACRNAWIGKKETIDECVDDHLEMEELIRELRNKGRAAPWEDFDRLMEIMNEHFEEEENEVFLKIGDLLSERDEEDLADRLRARRIELESGSAAA